MKRFELRDEHGNTNAELWDLEEVIEQVKIWADDGLLSLDYLKINDQQATDVFNSLEEFEKEIKELTKEKTFYILDFSFAYYANNLVIFDDLTECKKYINEFDLCFESLMLEQIKDTKLNILLNYDAIMFI